MAFVFPTDLFHKALIKRLDTYLISDLLLGRMLIQADGHEKNIFCVRTKWMTPYKPLAFDILPTLDFIANEINELFLDD